MTRSATTRKAAARQFNDAAATAAGNAPVTGMSRLQSESWHTAQRLKTAWMEQEGNGIVWFGLRTPPNQEALTDLLLTRANVPVWWPCSLRSYGTAGQAAFRYRSVVPGLVFVGQRCEGSWKEALTELQIELRRLDGGEPMRDVKTNEPIVSDRKLANQLLRVNDRIEPGEVGSSILAFRGEDLVRLKRFMDGLTERKKSARPVFEAGQDVEITEGPLQGYIAQVQKSCGDELSVAIAGLFEAASVLKVSKGMVRAIRGAEDDR